MLGMSDILVVGSSSGIGRALVKVLVSNKHSVWGIARRKNLQESLQKELKENKNYFRPLLLDISKKGAWGFLVSEMKKRNFKPEVTIFLAAINPGDFDKEVDLPLTTKIMEVNFFAVLKGLNNLLSYLGTKAHYIAISSSSAFKGSAKEGIGYSASKASLGLAFEAFHQRYFRCGPYFSTIYFGPVDTGMKRFRHKPFFAFSEKKAVEVILEVIRSRKPYAFCPFWFIFGFRLLKLIMPDIFYLKLINLSEGIYNDN